MNRIFRNILILSRVANLPTVWSNVTAGWTFGVCLLAFDLHNGQKLLELIFNLQLVLLLIGASCIYAAGMILNDIFDRDWDRAHRPERPLVTGRISLSTARAVASVLLGTGIVLTILSGAPSARLSVGILVSVLIAAVFIYNRWHKGVTWAPYIMGLCRSILPLIGFFAAGAASSASSTAFLILLTHVASLWILTVSITFLARHETSLGGASSVVDYVLLLVPVPLLVILPWNGPIVVSALGYWLWVMGSNQRRPLPAGVVGRVEDRLASFPFIDAMLVGLTFGILPSIAVATVHAFTLSCFVLVLIGRRFVPVT